MAIVLARVDNRLVHGQILEAWVPHLRADAILVVDRTRIDDPLERALLEGLGSRELEVRLTAPAEAVGLLTGAWAERRVIVLFPDVERAVEALEAGLDLQRLNLGNIHPTPGARRVTPSVHVAAEDETRLSAILARGVELEARAVPSDRSTDPFGAGGSR